MAKRRIKKPVRKKKSDYPGEMSFRKALGMNPTYYQEGGKLCYQENPGQLPPSTGFNFSGYLDGNQGLIPDYNNIPTKSHISNILFNTPLPVVKPADKPKKSDVLDLDNSLDYLVNTRGGTRDLWGRMADTIGYHESAHTMNPLQKQIGGGPGRGIFQFEAPSLVTAQNRYKRIASKLNLKTDPEILNAKSALELSPEQQYSLFLINLSESKAKLKDYADNKLPLVDLWLQGHKNKEAITDRGSFRTSVQKAKKESIKNGYSTLKEFGGKLYYQEDIGELPIITKDPNDPRIKEYELRKKLYESNVYPPEGVTMYSFDEYKPDAYTLYTPRDTKKEEYLGYDSWALSRMNQGNSDFVDIDSNKRVTPKIKPSKFYDAIIRKYIDDPANQNYIQNSFKNYVLDPNSNILSYTDKPDKSFLLDPENSAKVFNRGLFFDTSNKLCADGHCSNVVTSTFGVPIYDPPGRPVVYDNIGSISKEWGRNWKSTESGKGAPPRPGMNTSNANTVNPDDFGYYYQIRFNDGKSKILTPEEYEQYKTTEEYINHENIINAEKQRQQRLRDERRNRISSRKLGGFLPRAQMLGGKLRYARGGSLTSAQDTAQAADLNQDVVRKDQKKATVWEDIAAAGYGVGAGTLDALTFGLTDELTDAGFKGLQAAAGHDINSDEAKRQAGIAGWGNVAGAVTGAIINPGAIGSAAEEGLEGIGTGIEGIDPNSGIATGIGTALKGMGSSKMLSGLNDKDKIPQGMQGFSKLFMARNGGRFRYGYQGGGHMVNQNMGLTEIDGPSHEDGGVTLPNSGGRPDVEVEGPETIYTPENYVMSEKMKASKEALEYAGITGKAASRLAGKSYADLSKSIKSKAGDKLRPADPLSKKMLDKEMKRLMMAHEYDREAKRMKDEAMRSQMMGGSNIVAETPEERAGGYNMYPNAESIAFPGSGPTSVVPTYNNDPIMVTGADGSQQMLTDEPIETEAPFIEQKMAQGGKMIKRADGSYSRRGLWDNIRANRGSGRKPTKQMLEQEAKIKAAEKAYGGYYADGGSFDNPGFRALPDYVQAKIKSNMALGGFMGDYIDEDDTMEYGSGGYTVRRSNDRKGKTHVVTGPDGTKKYFGDPKLGERGKSKYGKKGFYARHKKNLAKNPYFRAYARATWEDGGYMNMLDSNVDMVDMETPMYEYGGSMMYGQGGGIHIDPSKRGTFKAQASRMGMGVQQAARTILNAPEGKYSPAMRKKANFARNFAKADGGYMYQMGGEMMPEEMMAAEQQAAMQQGQQPQGGGQEQIIQAIVEMLQQGLQPEQIVGELVKMGVPQEAAIQVVQMVMQQVQQSQGMQQQQQAAPPFEQGMMGQQQGAPAPATMRGGGRMYQMGGSLADTYLQNLNKPKPLFRNGGKLYYQSAGSLPDNTSTLENILNDNTIESGVYQGADAIAIGKQANANANANTGIKPILFPRPSLRERAIFLGNVNAAGSMPSVNNRFNPELTMTPQEKTNWLNKTRGYSGLLPDEGYAAINQFENTMGTYDAQGNPIGMGMGDQYAQSHPDHKKIEEYINKNIGIDNWNKMPDNLRTQIYSFMFNHGNYDNVMRGLNQAVLDSTGAGGPGGVYTEFEVDPSTGNLIDESGRYRSTLSTKFDPNVDYSNPDIYANYINVLGSQYDSIARNTAKYKTGAGAKYAPTLRNRAISIHNNLYPSGYSFPSSTSAQSATVVPQAAVASTVTQPNAGTGVLLNPTQIALRNFNQARPSSTLAGKPEKYQEWQPNTAPIVAGGLSAGITPIANLVASITGRDTRAAAPLKFEKPDYTPVAIQRAAANQALANTREAFRRGAPTQGNYLSNLAVTAPSLAANVGREIAGKRFEIGKSRAEIDMKQQLANDQIGRFNLMNQARDQAAREQLRLEAAKGFSTIGQGVTKDLGETLYEANILRNLETKDFSPFNYIKDEKGRFKQVLSPRGAALYRDNTTNNQIVRDNQGNKYMILPGEKIQLIQE